MADQSVYLVSKVTAAMRESSLSFVDDEGLSALLGDGWEVTTNMQREVSVAGKRVKATMMILKQAADNRGVSVRGRDRDDLDRPAGGTMISMDDGFGNSKDVPVMHALGRVLQSVERGLARSGEAGHLGASVDHSLPGMTIIPSSVISKAYDIGMNAAMTGKTEAACPFPSGSHPHSQWMKGFRKGLGTAGAPASPEEASGARQAGVVCAREHGPDDEVSCPYPAGSPLRRHWVEGFRSAGGRVEE